MSEVSVSKWILSLCLLWASFIGSTQLFAQSAVAPADEYVDQDAAAIAFHPGPGRFANYRRAIDAHLRENPRNVTALAQRAYIHYATGYLEHGERDYSRALELASDDPVLQRRVLWSWGWSLWIAEQPQAALQQWQRAEKQHGGRPFWVPYTYALAYWQLEQRDLAVAFYAAAVRSDARWGSEAGFQEKTEHWRDSERAIGRELLAAWTAATRVDTPH
jgi:tetratricopeptide (TPR) repeat protein